MKEANKRLKEESEAPTVPRGDVIEYIAFSYYTQGNLAKALQYTNELIAVEPDHPRAEGNKLYYETHLNDNVKTDHKKGDDGTEVEAEPDYSVLERNLIDNAENEQSIYKRLCRGEIVKPNLHAKNLKCRYSHDFIHSWFWHLWKKKNCFWVLK